MSRVQRPAFLMDPETHMYMDQCEADIAELVEALEMASVAWAAKLSMMPNIKERERLDEARALIAKHTEAGAGEKQ